MDGAIKKYQKDRDLRVDGLLHPNGETEKYLKFDISDKKGIESEELPPPNIPGTNIPDRGFPEHWGYNNSVQEDKDRWRYKMDNGIIKAPPVMDQGIEVPVIGETYGPWSVLGIGKRI